MTCRTGIVSGAAAVAMVVGFASSTWAQATNTPDEGGQLNQCWGQVASGTAQLDTPEGTSGGGMGQHSRSTQAANLNGGFAADGNGFNITFNELNDEGNHGREGVGNVSAGENHNAHPGDGGNGVHAINNAVAANTLDPVTGQFQTGPIAQDQQLGCELP